MANIFPLINQHDQMLFPIIIYRIFQLVLNDLIFSVSNPFIEFEELLMSLQIFFCQFLLLAKLLPSLQFIRVKEEYQWILFDEQVNNIMLFCVILLYIFQETFLQFMFSYIFQLLQFNFNFLLIFLLQILYSQLLIKSYGMFPRELQ